MTRIYKYILETTDLQEIVMPVGAEILCVQTQNDTPCVWARVNPEALTCSRKFLIFGTGHDISVDPGRCVGTYQLSGGSLIFHLYETPT